MRLAWFSPWPPDPSGVAGRSAELTAVLAGRHHAIDVFVDERRIDVDRRQPATPPSPGQVRVLSAHDFVWREARAPYDLAVYQVGNSAMHDHIWPYLFRWPGLAVLHDGRLNHARTLALLSRGRTEDYRAEFAWNHPDVPPLAAELGLGAFEGVYQYQWPMVRGVLDSSKVVATHARGAMTELQQASPERPVEYIALGEGVTDVSPAARQALRLAHGIPDHAVVFGVFGGLTAEKRVPQILRAFAAIRAGLPGARLVLAGEPEEVLDLDAMTRTLGLAGSTIRLGRLGAAAFDAWFAAVDVSLHLRWPSALEMSGPWLRALSAGRATIIVDLPHLTSIPTLDPRSWAIHGPVRPDAGPAVAVAISILDEDHSLRLAMRRLATDAPARETLGRHARAYWEAEHTVSRMADDYERVMARARTAPPPAVARPAHMTPDPWAHTRAQLAEFGPDTARILSSLAPAPES